MNTADIAAIFAQQKVGIRPVVFQKIMDAIAVDNGVPVHAFKLPALPPGVRPDKPPSGDALFLAMDSEGRTETLAMDDGGAGLPAFGWLNGYNQFGCNLAFPGYPYLANLVQISEYRAPSEVISTEMTRKWLRLVGKGKVKSDDKIKELTGHMHKHRVRDKFAKCAWYDGIFGRGQLYMEIKGQNDDLGRQKPLMVEDNMGVSKGSLINLQPIEPYWTTPCAYNASHPERADYYVPSSWYVMGRKTHDTRLLMFCSREVPDILKPSYNFGGISMSQLMEPYVTMWLRTRKSVNDLINIFSILNLATDMDATLSGGDGAEVITRMRLFQQSRSNGGLLMTNKGTEELSMQNVPLGSLDKLQAQSQEHMAAPCHIPLIKLFGAVPTGLNATGEGEIQVWYDFVRACQENLFGPQMNILLKVLMLDLWGAVDENIGYEWVPLDEPTAKEKAEERKSDADRDSAYIQAGVVSPDEVRQKLQADPNSGYDGLVGDAPEPPEEKGEVDEDGNPIGGPDGDDEGEEAAAAAESQTAPHQHEAGENEKDRQHEIKLANVKAKAKPAAKPPAKKKK
jgi:phage-related protein (TIGR01555 family)